MNKSIRQTCAYYWITNTPVLSNNFQGNNYDTGGLGIWPSDCQASNISKVNSQSQKTTVGILEAETLLLCTWDEWSHTITRISRTIPKKTGKWILDIKAVKFIMPRKQLLS